MSYGSVIWTGATLKRPEWSRRRLPESGITAKGQTTLPKPVREALGLGPGDRVRYFVVDGEVRMRPLRPIRRLLCVIAHDVPPATLDDMERAIIDGATDR